VLPDVVLVLLVMTVKCNNQSCRLSATAMGVKPEFYSCMAAVLMVVYFAASFQPTESNKYALHKSAWARSAL
jgi:hypothetical protein